jgi:hypothetical protein
VITEIGITSGEIWQYLDKNSQASIAELVKVIGKPKDLILMSLGWLGREGHINFEGKKKLKISLKK